MISSTLNSAPHAVFGARDIAGWRPVAKAAIADHYHEFQHLIEVAASLAHRRRYREATAASQLAATYAMLWHPGQFASPRLEQTLRTIGAMALPFCAANRPLNVNQRQLVILHIATCVHDIGGHVRMMWRWIRHDPGHCHSVALTRQYRPIPPQLSSAVRKTGGRVHVLNGAMGGLLAWAGDLQTLIHQADIVVLHTNPNDTIPFLALAGMANRPPVALLNHADHIFWLGTSFADLIVSTRRSGLRLCVERRGLVSGRNFLLPLCLDATERTMSKQEARRALGWSNDAFVILSIARGLKFKPFAGTTYADAFVPVLQEDPRRRLVVVGALGAVDWSDAEAKVPGQIITFEERSDTKAFLEAADLYVDSFPFASITSLFEAGLFGLPLLSRQPSGNTCDIFGADSPGLDAVILRTQSIAQFQSAICDLAVNGPLRDTIGRQTQAEILTTNTGENWKSELRLLYARLLRAASADVTDLYRGDRRQTDDEDVFSLIIAGTQDYGHNKAERLRVTTELELRNLPFLARLCAFIYMAFGRGFQFRSKSKAWHYLMPEWLAYRLRNFLVILREKASSQ